LFSLQSRKSIVYALSSESRCISCAEFFDISCHNLSNYLPRS
jgi:hypothetical protein